MILIIGEYCNSPAGSTTLAEVRAAAGFPEPFNVRYWGVGNESWGCGGNFTREAYASEFRRYSDWIPRYGLELQLIGSGPSDNDVDWTHRFFQQIYSDPAYNNPSFTGWSVHHYAWNLSRGKTKDLLAGKGDALQFDSVDWYELLRECDRMEQIIQDQWAVMGQYDALHHVKLVVDEYGPWYREGTELDPTHLFGQQITLRDALGTALTLDTFNRNPEKVSMAACAQLINNINALFMAHEDHFFATPNFHVFAMYAAHQSGQALRAVFSAPDVHYMRDDQQGSPQGPQRLSLAERSCGHTHHSQSRVVENKRHPDCTPRRHGRECNGHGVGGKRHARAQHVRSTERRDAYNPCGRGSRQPAQREHSGSLGYQAGCGSWLSEFIDNRFLETPDQTKRKPNRRAPAASINVVSGYAPDLFGRIAEPMGGRASGGSCVSVAFAWAGSVCNG